MGTAHPLPSSLFGIVALQGLGKDVVSDMKLLFFFSMYDFWEQALRPIPHSSSVVIA